MRGGKFIKEAYYPEIAVERIQEATELDLEKDEVKLMKEDPRYKTYMAGF